MIAFAKRSSRVLGGLDALMGASWEVLGRSRKPLGSLLGVLWSFLGVLMALFKRRRGGQLSLFGS